MTDEEGHCLGMNEISRRTGLSTATISQCLRIQTRSALRTAVEEERLDIGRAMRLVSVPDEVLEDLIERARSLSQQDPGREVAAINRNPEISHKRTVSPNQCRVMHAYEQLMLIDEVDSDLHSQLDLVRRRVEDLLAL